MSKVNIAFNKDQLDLILQALEAYKDGHMDWVLDQLCSIDIGKNRELAQHYIEQSEEYRSLQVLIDNTRKQMYGG